MPLRMQTKFKQLILSVIAGAIYPLGFAPFAYWPMPVLSVALVFWIWSRSDRRMVLWSALLYGLSLYGVGVSWIYVSMVNFGNMAPPMAVIAVILFALILTAFTLVPAYLYSRITHLFSPGQRLTLLLPALWVIFEYLRGTLFTGFAWLYLGYASVDTWLSAWSPVAGVLSASYVLAVIAGLLALAWQRWQSEGVILAAIKFPLAMIVVLTMISWALQGLRWTEQSGPALEVTLVQADISLADKWRPEKRSYLMQTYLQASRAAGQADLVVWPEASLPMSLDQVPPEYLDELKALPGAVAFGVIQRSEDGSQLYNGLAVLDEMTSTEGEMQIYRKRHLVPFGEFFPFKPILGWLFESLSIPMSDFARGTASQGNLTIGSLKLVPTICYEDAYPEDWRRQVREAHAIVNISEDAWFGDSFAPHQRLEMARMRAIEFQRPVIRVSNSGLSTVIDSYGEMDAISPQFQPALFSSPVYPMQGVTPYMRSGQWPLWLWLLLSLAAALLFDYRKRIDQSKTDCA